MRNWWRKLAKRRSNVSAKMKNKKGRRVRPFLESLENRWLPAPLTDGVLVQFDQGGEHPLLGNVQSASVAFGPNGQVLEVVTTDGQLTQLDAAGAHPLLTNVQSADTAF